MMGWCDRTVNGARGREVHDGVVAGQRGRDRVPVGDVALDERVARVVVEPATVTPLVVAMMLTGRDVARAVA